MKHKDMSKQLIAVSYTTRALKMSVQATVYFLTSKNPVTVNVSMCGLVRYDVVQFHDENSPCLSVVTLSAPNCIIFSAAS
jgi:hypothetical protein